MLRNVANTTRAPSEVRRAQRFALTLPVRYRLQDEKLWRSGETENASASGVLFRSQSGAKAGTCLELCLALPPEKSEEAPEVICRGIVVRSATVSDGSARALAVRILHSRLTRG